MSEEEDYSQLDTTDEMVAEGRSYTGVMPDDMPKYMAKTILGIDLFNLRVGQIACWLTVPVFASMFYEVIARHFFNAPTMWAYDISRMFAGAMFMLGAGYALSKVCIFVLTLCIVNGLSEGKLQLISLCIYCFIFRD